ncbi:DUF4349 domain-containing protein [Streptomyces sp. BG9H]|uniref:DUF4349 domain-containing protein n=1 Tax=Streptomyces anatolicus TaxID=2675858 RepID=A0ABS6YRD6_9ACTN|nr:DUF4349 domain-containing protein [Streptomyces anatolicus]MBW5423998.1 DUF4349 domain-containing protein [Streptomyces anatolicus]
MHTSSRLTVQALLGLLLAVALALTGCTASGDGDSGGDAKGAAADHAAGPQGAEDAAGAQSGEPGKSPKRKPSKVTGPQVIRTARLTVRVGDVPKALEEARAAAENAGGIVGNENTSRDDEGRERSRVVLRVPQNAYEEVLTALEGTGKLIDREAKAQDVTDQVVDVESRVKSQRASVARVRELMDKATKLSDVVTLEGELSTRQADLESLLAQRASLKDRTAMATITLSLTERQGQGQASTGDDDPTLGDALGGGWDTFTTGLRWIAIALAAILPFAAVAALLLLLWLRVVRPRRGRDTP